MSKQAAKSKVQHAPTIADEPVDPHLKEIADAVNRLRLKRGMSRRALATAIDLHDTHLGQFLKGRQGISIEALERAARVLGASTLRENDEQSPTRFGTVDRSGRIMTDLDRIPLPGIVEVTEATGDFAPGEQIYVRAASAFEAGKWVIVERVSDATRHFVQCLVLDGGTPFLRTPSGDEWRYVTDRYRVVAVAYYTGRAI